MITEIIEALPDFPKGKYEIETYAKGKEDLVIELISDIGKRIKVTFIDNIVGYQVYEEECDVKRVHDLCDKIGREVVKDRTFFKVADSLMVFDIINKSYGFYEKSNLCHYLIMSSNYILDIITMGSNISIEERL